MRAKIGIAWGSENINPAVPAVIARAPHGDHEPIDRGTLAECLFDRAENPLVRFARTPPDFQARLTGRQPSYYLARSVAWADNKQRT
jgi:hypothetical protein